MEILSLTTNQLNQNGYTKNTLTKSKIGALYTFPTLYTPDDCLSCEGYSLSISDYKDLYKVIGTQFNKAEDEDGTFRIPDYNISQRFLQPGINIGSQIEAGLPNLTGSVITSGANLSSASGVFSAGTSAKNRDDNLDTNGKRVLSFDASLSNPIYGKSSTVQPSSQIVHVCIKYK